MGCNGWWLSVVLSCALCACGGTSNNNNDDGGTPDSGSDSGADSSTDSGTDSGADAGPSGACLNAADMAVLAKASSDEGFPPGTKTGDQAVTAALQGCIGSADNAETKDVIEGCVSLAVDLLSGVTPEKIDALNTCLRSCTETKIGTLTTACVDCFIEVTTCGAQNCVGDCFCITQNLCCNDDTGCQAGDNCNACLMGMGVLAPNGPNCVANFEACSGFEETLFRCEDQPELCPSDK